MMLSGYCILRFGLHKLIACSSTCGQYVIPWIWIVLGSENLLTVLQYGSTWI